MTTEPRHAPPSLTARSDSRRIVVLVGEATEDLARAVARCASDETAEVLAISPALPSGWLGAWGIGLGSAEREAERRLADAVDLLEQRGVRVRGYVAEADPVLALVEALRLYPADALVVDAHPRDGGRWPEQRLLDQARRFGVGASHLIVHARPRVEPRPRLRSLHPVAGRG